MQKRNVRGDCYSYMQERPFGVYSLAAEQFIELGLELLVASGPLVRVTQFIERGHQRLRHVAAAERSEPSGGVGKLGEAGHDLKDRAVTSSLRRA